MKWSGDWHLTVSSLPSFTVCWQLLEKYRFILLNTIYSHHLNRLVVEQMCTCYSNFSKGLFNNWGIWKCIRSIWVCHHSIAVSIQEGGVPNVLKWASQPHPLKKCPVTHANNARPDRHGLVYESMEMHWSNRSWNSVLITDGIGVQRRERTLWG